MDAISKDNKTILETTVSSMNPLRPIQIKRALHQKRPDLAKAVCQTLGIEYNDLILKSKEEMYDPKKLKEANDLIYDHYLKKYYRRVAKVDAKIKEMIYLGKTDPHYLGDHLKQRCHSSSESYDRTVRIETRANRQETYQDYVCSTHSARPHHVAHKSLQRETDHDSFNEMRIESSDQEIATSIVNNYKKKLERVQENWDEQTKNLRNKPIGDPNRLLNHALQSQIDRLNRNVEKAEKYAQSIIDLNEKRKQIKNEILQRDLKVKKVKRKLVAERNDLTQKNREYYQEKMKDIKTQQREYNTKLRKKAGKMQQRFQELEEKLMKEEEERKEVVKVKELEFVAKVSKAKDMKDAEYEEIFKEHKNVELRSHRQVEMMLSERRRKCEESAKSFRESYDKAKEKRDNLTAEKDSKTIGKIFKKSQGTDHIRELIQASIKKKHEESIEKQEIHRKNYREIVNNKAQWSKNILKNFRKSEERLKEFQEEKTRTLVLKKELHNLKKLDQLESFSGIMKLREMRNSQIIDKERADSLKMNMLREQSLILSQARIDVDRRTKQKVDGMIHVALKEGPENKSVDHKRFHRAASAAQLYF